MAAVAVTRQLVTSHGTVVFVDGETKLLRHGPAKTSPPNVVFRLQGATGSLVLVTPEGPQQPIRLCAGAEAAPVQLQAPDVETPQKLTVVATSEGVVGLTANALFLCAEIDGGVTLSRPQLGAWESFKLVDPSFVLAMKDMLPIAVRHRSLEAAIAASAESGTISALPDGPATGRLQDRRQMAIKSHAVHVTIGYPRTHNMKLLEQSASLNGFETLSLPKFWGKERINTIDKLTILLSLLNIGQIADDHIILFTDAYDVIILDHMNTIVNKFIGFGCDILFSAEANLYPDGADRDFAKRFFDQFNSKWRYLNSGCYMGFAWAIREMLEYIVKKGEADFGPAHWADQQLVQDFFIEKSKSDDMLINLDIECKIFGSTFMASDDDFRLDHAAIFNSSFPHGVSVLHANGDKNNLRILELYSDIFCSKSNGRFRDLRVGVAGDAIIEFDPQRRHLVLNDKVTEHAVIFLVSQNRCGVAITASSGILTFCPDGTTESGQNHIKEWERLSVRRGVFTHHGLLDRHLADRPQEGVVLAPLPLALLARPFATSLASLIDACYAHLVPI